METVATDVARTGADVPIVEWRGQAYGHRILLHFDIRAVDEAIRRRADRFLYGYREIRQVSTGRKTYRYPGLLERTGGRHYGQSVVILDPVPAEEAFYFLRGMKVPCQKVDILAPEWL